MKHYSVDIQVDFDKPRTMPPAKWSNGPWQAVGYFQYFYCTDQSKEKAKKIAIEHVISNETDVTSCQIRCDRIAWMRRLTSYDQLSGCSMGELTQEMFDNRNEYGIWYCSTKKYYVSEADYAASIDEDDL